MKLNGAPPFAPSGAILSKLSLVPNGRAISVSHNFHQRGESVSSKAKNITKENGNQKRLIKHTQMPQEKKEPLKVMIDTNKLQHKFDIRSQLTDPETISGGPYP